ncbi:ABC transporter ATP-binding protein [Suttonella ornithocola]|uniref:Multidrug export ATP-binding/permease protein SAV1866 n=1 Tax=Suttonella ornithocola TaxID=279832 RepID=A0A380MSV3_9GAMM|nr:ABC transporter ATP-binding protein [Suttonella ornithocola]SUO95382.1 Putative multidrug export ATP-binding/permease protein SAV1866 [Suttonella ornithocola]
MLNFFERWTNPFPDNSLDSPPKKLLAFCRFYAKGFWLPVISVAVFSLLLAIMEVSLFAFMGRIVDWLGNSHPETFLQDEQWRLWSMAFVLVIALPVVNTLSSLVRHQSLMGNFPMAVRWRMHRHLLDQSMSFYQDEFAGRISTKVMQTALAIRELILKTMDVMVYVAVYFLSMFVLLASLHWALLIPIGLWFIGYIFLQRCFVPRLKQVSQEQAHARSTMTGRITDAYTNISTVKLFAHTHRESEYARDSMNGFMQTVYRQFRLVTGLDVLMGLMNYLLIFFVAATGIGLWIECVLGAGAIAVAVSLALRMNGMSHWVMWEISGLFEQIGTITDGMNMLALPKTVMDAVDAKPLVLTAGDIRFEHVSFSYRRMAKDGEAHLSVIKDLNLHIRAGEKIGLVGRSGAGKSTLVNALLRFYDVQSGKILIDDQDIAQVTQESLRSHIAMVTQDTSLLHRSVRENILYGKPDATEAELVRAIAQAEAAEFIATLSDPQGNTGLSAQVGERGVKLSGGQRQRIAIARVLLKDAPILILDEATSALDSEVEAAIQESLNQLMEGKTVIAIAHRLSTIAQMDRLIVLEAGQIIEQGSHDELLAQNGMYARLWSRQTGGYLGDDE